jgi:hypothetical protein
MTLLVLVDESMGRHTCFRHIFLHERIIIFSSSGDFLHFMEADWFFDILHMHTLFLVACSDVA